LQESVIFVEASYLKPEGIFPHVSYLIHERGASDRTSALISFRHSFPFLGFADLGYEIVTFTAKGTDSPAGIGS
jgi:hypothetical protein